MGLTDNAARAMSMLCAVGFLLSVVLADSSPSGDQQFWAVLLAVICFIGLCLFTILDAVGQVYGGPRSASMPLISLFVAFVLAVLVVLSRASLA